MSAILNALQKALAADPENWETRLALVEAYENAGQRDEAAALLNQAETLPADDESLMAAVKAHALVDSNGGRKLVEEYLKENSASAKAHLALASAAHAEGDSHTAMRHFITATSLDASLSDPGLEEAYGEITGKTQAEPEPELTAESEPEAAESATEEEPAEAEETPVALEVVEDDDDEETLEATVALADEDEGEGEALAAQETEQPAEAESEPDAEAEAEPPTATASIRMVDPEEAARLAEIREKEHEMERLHEKQIRRDRINSLVFTIVAHIGVVILLGLIVTQLPMMEPPQIVAAAGAKIDEPDFDKVEIVKPQPTKQTSASNAMDVVAVDATSDVAVANVDLDLSKPPLDYGSNLMGPSMSFGNMSTAPGELMMFGEKMEGKVLGAVLDVSGSMAEYLPLVIREIDRNFKDAPIVYVNHALVQGSADGTLIYPIIAEEVEPTWVGPDGKRHSSPFWFLWGDLPRKAPQRSVDRLINTFRTRPNMFIARGGRNRIGAGIQFLIEQKVDTVYVFSDFEDYVEEELCEEMGQLLGRSNVKAYVQPAENETEHLHIVTNKIANRSNGRRLPPLVDLTSGDEAVRPPPIMVAEEEKLPEVEGVTHATPRDERVADEFFSYRRYYYRGNDLEELHVEQYPAFDLAIMGPQARAYIFLKDENGKYIQNPVIFGYHSWKRYQRENDEQWYTRHRKWLRNREEPQFEGDEFTWKMVLEDELEFDVKFWFRDNNFTGTYRAEAPEDGTSDGAYIYFHIPRLAVERKDMYHSHDFPAGITLDNLRLAMEGNFANFHLPSQAEDRYGTQWSQLGFGRGQNEVPYNKIFRDLPHGVREVEVYGRSFGPRRLKARTGSNRLLLQTGNRADMELWEGFHCRLVRPGDVRHRFTKTEAITFEVE